MAAPITNDEYLRQKIANFVAFISACLITRVNHERYAEARDKLEQLRVLDTGHFILYVTESMVPYRSNVPAFVEKLMKENNAKASDLSEEEHKKLCRYVELFIAVVSQ